MFVNRLGRVAGRSYSTGGTGMPSLGIRQNRFWKHAIFYPAGADAQHAHNLKSTDLTFAGRSIIGRPRPKGDGVFARTMLGRAAHERLLGKWS